MSLEADGGGESPRPKCARRGARDHPQARQCTTAWPPSTSSRPRPRRGNYLRLPRQPARHPSTHPGPALHELQGVGADWITPAFRRRDDPRTAFEVTRLILPRLTAVMPGCPWPTQAATLSAARCIGPPSVQRVQRAIPERAPVALAGASLKCRWATSANATVPPIWGCFGGSRGWRRPPHALSARRERHRDLGRPTVVSVARGSGGEAPGCLAPRGGPPA